MKNDVDYNNKLMFLIKSAYKRLIFLFSCLPGNLTSYDGLMLAVCGCYGYYCMEIYGLASGQLEIFMKYPNAY